MFKLFGDTIIWWTCILFFITSMLLVYSSGGSALFMNHITHLLMGLGLVFIFSRFNYKYFTNLSTILLGVSICMLLWLIVNPSAYRGDVLASRWIKLGFFSFQPSELAKYSLILFVSRNLVLHEQKLYLFRYFFSYIILPTIIISALIIQSNLSTVILIISIVFFMVFISGYPFRLYVRNLIIPCIIPILLFSFLLVLPPIKLVDQTLPRLTTWKNRICAQEINKIPFSWVDDTNYDPTENYNNNYQINKALGAINRGGVIGKGAGKSYYKRILPDSKSDFIFAILIEEYGLIGGIIVIILYLIFYQRVLLLSVNSSEKFPRLLLLGLGTIIVLQALLHMSVSVNLIPVTGQTLPLISKGGSSLWVTSLAFGIILNISYQINLEDKI